jgi:hypothetical protein
MAKKARQRRLAIQMLSEIVDSDLGKFYTLLLHCATKHRVKLTGYDTLEGRHELTGGRARLFSFLMLQSLKYQSVRGVLINARVSLGCRG